MKLSEAIRLGSLAITKDPMVWLARTMDGGCRGCAVGAAIYAVGVRPETKHEFVVDTLVEHWPWTRTWPTLAGNITIIFNRDGFEAAAKYVEAIEESVPKSKEEVCERQYSA